jgi:DNA-binding CsgD family transcriptional regulator
VGRHAELDTVDDALRRGRSLVLVTGEAGIGKTRLAAAALERARGRAATVLAAGCLPLAEKLPLLPVADALRQLSHLAGGRVLERLLAELPPYVRTELSRLLPQLADVRPATPGGGDGGREHLFTAVGEVLDELARHNPTVLLVEDVHWADRETLDLLTWLGATAEGSALSVVATCRSDEAPPRTDVARWLSHCRRRGSTEVRLSPLGRDEVAELAAALVAGPVSDLLVDDLYARAEGNPFLTEQLVAAGGSAPPREIPGHLAELLAVRVDLVGGDARTVLAALSVAGRPLTESVLCPVAGLDAGTVRSALRELADASLLAVPGPEGACRPRHALLAEAVLTGLLPGERVSLHARVAEALETTGDPALSAEIAAHWAAAGQPAAELGATVAAAEAAVSVLAYADAAARWQRAIALSDQLPEAAAARGVDPVRLHLEAVNALDAAGQVRDAALLAEHAYDRFGASPDRDTAAAVHLLVARYRLMTRPGPLPEVLERAVRLVADGPPTADQAEALLMYANALCFGGHSQSTRPLIAKAIRVAEAAEAPAPLVHALALAAVMDLSGGELQAGFAALRRARVLADALDDVDPSLWVDLYEAMAWFGLARLDEVERVAVAGAERARRGGRGETLFGRHLLAFAAMAALLTGDPGRAARLVDPATGGPPTSADWLVHHARGWVDLHRGDLGQATRRLEAVRGLGLYGHVEWAWILTPTLAEAHLWRRAPGDALELVEDVVARCEDTDQAQYCGGLLALGARAAADLAERGRARGEATSEEAGVVAMDRLTAAVDRMGGRPFADNPCCAWIPVQRAAWTAEAGRVAGASDPDAWATAATEWEKIAVPVYAGYAWWRCAEAWLTRTGRPADAAPALRAAAAAATGMVPLRDAVHRLARRTRIPVDEAPGEPGSGTGVVDPYGLTPRERLVLHLLAEGRTNTQIGARLYMSPKTASVHVTRILRKLGVANRTAAATVAERAGLLDDLG